MPFSPVDAVVSPGVFVETITDIAAAGIVGFPRIPFVIAVGEEESRTTDLQMHRGSSSVVDNFVYREDLSDQIDGINGVRTFQLANFPIVTGSGTGTTSVDPNDVVVLLNGRRAALAQIDGALGLITLVELPVDGDTLTVDYFYRRRDTLVTDADVSAQANGATREFRVPLIPIVQGDDSGLATTDATKVTVTVDGAEVDVEAVDGQNGLVTLVNAPDDGAEVLVTYYTNKWQNTYDELPASVASVLRVGTIPGRTDFINTVDYVVDGNKIYWGTFAILRAGFTAAGSNPFSATEIQVTTVDDRTYLEQSAVEPDGSLKVFTTSQVPVDGTGQGIHVDRQGLQAAGDAVDLVEAYFGATPVAAKAAGRKLVAKVLADSRQVHLDEAPPAPVFATGTVTFAAANVYADGDGFALAGQDFVVERRATVDITIADDSALDGKYLTLDDGINDPVTFEFDDDSSIEAGRTAVTIGANESATAANLAAAIAAKAIDGELNVTVAVVGPAVTVTTIKGGDVGDILVLDGTIGVPAEISLAGEYQGYSAGIGEIGFSEGDDRTATAANAIAAINAAGLDVAAVAGAAGVVNLTATVQGGNAITLAVLNAAVNIAVSGANLAGNTDSFVFFTYYRSRISDKVYTLKVTRSGPDEATAGGPGLVGQYTVTDADGNSARQVAEETSLHTIADVNFPGNVATPAGNFDWAADPDNGIDETVTITFDSATAFTVTSNEAEGSAGTGFIGQTYIDVITGLRFTLADPQVAANTSVLYNYQAGDVVVLRVRAVHDVGNFPTYSLPGLRTVVLTSEDIPVNNTALVYTYNKIGNEPKVGDFYFISFTAIKDDTAYQPQLFFSERDRAEELGEATLANPASLATRLAFLNNNQLVGLVQVRRQGAGLDATLTEYQRALAALEHPLTGGFQPDVIVPMTGDQTVIGEVKAHVERMSSPMFGQERRAIFGVELGTTLLQAQTLALALRSQRSQLIWSAGGGMVIRLADQLGRDLEYPVPATYLAAAYAGLDTSPRYDVAEPMTRKTLAGFVRAVGQSPTETEASVAARQGVTIIDDLSPTHRVRWAVTTDTRSVITREANFQKIDDEVHRRQRRELDRFIGTKGLSSRLADVEEALSAMYGGMVGEIIAEFQPPSAAFDAQDPTNIVVEGRYRPIGAVNFITVRNRLTLEQL